MTKVNFIIAYNTDNIGKCIECINNLQIPDGVVVDTLGVEGNNTISEVYNACQTESEADYRVFLRENVYIVNSSFLHDMLAYFEENPQIYAAGILGGHKSGDFIDWDCGAIDIVNDDRADRFVLGEVEKPEFLSGQMIVAKNRIDWSNDGNTDFDISFSERAVEAGQKLGVFPQNEPWCIWEYGGTYSERADVFDTEKGSFAFVGKEKPLVSVMIAIHNGADFVRDTVDSLLSQTYQNLQIILVDDCSTDETASIIKAYSEMDSRIVPLYLPRNRHICYAVNEGYKYATGKYVANMGHDDLCRPWKFEEQVAFMERFDDYAVCLSLCHIINDYLEMIDDRSIMTRLLGHSNHSREEWLRALFYKGNCFCIPSAIIRKSMIPEGPLYRYDIVQLQDYELWMRILLKGSFHILQEKITLYRFFEKERKNLSNVEADGADNSQRYKLAEESGRLKAEFLTDMSDENFVKYFACDFKHKDSSSKLELLCERALILLRMENRRFYDVVSKIMRTEEGVKLLDEKYGLSTIEFYGTEARFFIQ